MRQNVLLVGTGYMATEYFKVLSALNCEISVIGNSEESSRKFGDQFGIHVYSGSTNAFCQSNNPSRYNAAIVAVSIEALAGCTMDLLEFGIKSILVEKPGGVNKTEIEALSKCVQKNNASVFVAYNRRFYASVIKAKEIIEQDGGVLSFNFEFTEWSHVIEHAVKSNETKSNWFIANSTHVIDLAFFLGGRPEQISCFSAKELSWHKPAIFAGAGLTNKNALFNYQANWLAPGRWSVEILTANHRLIFKPLEKLQYQLRNSMEIQMFDLGKELELDVTYKPGIYQQVQAFLNSENSSLCSINEQREMFREFYSQMIK